MTSSTIKYQPLRIHRYKIRSMQPAEGTQFMTFCIEEITSKKILTISARDLAMDDKKLNGFDINDIRTIIFAAAEGYFALEKIQIQALTYKKTTLTA